MNWLREEGSALCCLKRLLNKGVFVEQQTAHGLRWLLVVVVVVEGEVRGARVGVGVGAVGIATINSRSMSSGNGRRSSSEQ